MERPVGELGAVHARHLQRERVRVGERALGHQRRHDRDARLLGERPQLGLGAGVDDAAADVEHRLLGARDRERRLLDLQRVALARRAVAGQIDLLRPAERERRIGDVLRDVDQHRPRAARRGQVEGLHEHARDVLDLRDEVGVLDDRHEDAGRVGLLEGVRADQVRRHLARDDHERRRVEERVGHRRDEVRRTGPGRRQGDADPARGARVALRHVAGALLVAHQHVLDLGSRRGERVVDRKDRPAGDPEADLDAARLERADNGLRAGEPLAFVGIGRGRLGGGSLLFCGGHRSLPVVGQWAVGWSVERASEISAATSSVVALPPRSGVRAPSSSTPVTAASMRARRGGLPELVEQQRDREDRAGGVGGAAAGDVGRRAVDRLEDARAAVGERGRGREPDAAADGGGEVGEDVAEEVLGHDHVVGGRGARRAASPSSRRAGARASRRDARGDLGRDAPPELGGREHVGLVDARDAARAALGDARTRARRCGGSRRRCSCRCRRRRRRRGRDRRSRCRRSARARSGGRGRPRARRAAGSSCAACSGARAQVGVAAEHRAQREQALLGPHLSRRSSAGRRRRRAARRPRPGRPRAWRRGTACPSRRSRRRRTAARPARRRSRSATKRPPARAAPPS